MESPLANWMPAKRWRWRTMKPWGVCFHTSGRGIVERAKRQGVAPGALALKWYRARARSGVHYLIDHNGTIFQMLGDDRRGAHVGISRTERRAYLSGNWEIQIAGRLTAAPAMAWRRRWPDHASPQHLFPTRSPNGCYIGVEMIPLATADVGANGLWFTEAQHIAAGALARDLSIRHGWPLGWENSPRMIGHEDIDAFARWDKRGGWDPGAMRDGPRFDWGRVLSSIAMGRAG
ncbi:MAG: N-acetylmuramoyl-L-alanine amidase [Myxococcales bacterium]|nr:N-acetylmuramoyl-L-alanine amidase [Myxococcales bacterium]